MLMSECSVRRECRVECGERGMTDCLEVTELILRLLSPFFPVLLNLTLICPGFWGFGVLGFWGPLGAFESIWGAFAGLKDD